MTDFAAAPAAGQSARFQSSSAASRAFGTEIDRLPAGYAAAGFVLATLQGGLVRADLVLGGEEMGGLRVLSHTASARAAGWMAGDLSLRRAEGRPGDWNRAASRPAEAGADMGAN
jgi:hypothetical protein